MHVSMNIKFIMHVDVSSHTELSLWSFVVWLPVSTSSINHLQVNYTRTKLSLVEFCGKTVCYGATYWKWSAVWLISRRILRVVSNYTLGREKLLRQQAHWCRETSMFSIHGTWVTEDTHHGTKACVPLYKKCVSGVCYQEATAYFTSTSVANSWPATCFLRCPKRWKSLGPMLVMVHPPCSCDLAQR
jgi:hypothetical protein